MQGSAPKKTISDYSAGPEKIARVISDKRRIFVTAGVMVGMFLAAIEATAVSTAMPTVVSSLGGLNIYSWVFSAYFLTSTVTLPLWGKLSDLYGRRIFYVIGITIFLLGSALSGQSESMLELIIFRAIQGIGGGALLTLGMIIIGEIFSLEERARVQGLFGGVWGLSSIAGPLLGGFITDHFSWRWVFYLNIPFGLIAALIMGLAFKERIDKSKKVSLDYKGAIIISTLITLLLTGLMKIGKENGLDSPPTLLMLLICIPLFWIFISAEKRAEDPILPLELFSNPFFKTSAITGFLIGMAMFGSISFLPLFIQGVIGTTATRAGMILSPLLLSWVFFSSISGRLMLGFGYRPLILVGTAIVTIGFLLLTRMNEETKQLNAILNMLFLGSGMGMIFIPLLLSVQNSVPRNRLGIATSATQFFRLIGATVGVSVMGVVMNAFMHQGLNTSANGLSADQLPYIKNPDLILNPAVREQISPEVLGPLREILAHSLHYVFIAGLVMAVLAFLSSFLIPKGRVEDKALEKYNYVGSKKEQIKER
ncbi:MAG TPA: MDR family MFS transporter [Thermodesulfobacteriota bacterium]|nr:MDR family MFS transporter [Thermodesulfobacteriota bacterium]